MHSDAERFTYISLQKKLDKFSTSGKSFEVFQNICLCTLDIIMKCAFSYDEDIQQAGWVRQSFTVKLILTHYLIILCYYQIMTSYLRGFIAMRGRRRMSLERGKK